MIAEAEARGVDVEAAVRHAGLDRAAIDSWRVQLPGSQCEQLWDRLVQLTGDPHLPLHAADRVPFGAFDVIDHLGAHSPTVGDVWAMLARYFGIVNGVIRPRLQAAPDGWCIDVPGSAFRGGEVFFAVTLGRLRHLLGRRFEPLRVELSRLRTPDDTISARVFGPGLRYGQARTAVVLSDAQFREPIPGPNADLRAILEEHAQRLMAEVQRPTTLAERVARELRGMLGQEDLGIARVARRLGTSARTLQRRLRSDGEDFRAIRARTRLAVAEQHLRENALGVEEVAFLLGYSDGTAFQRAFKGWTGLTIGQWRRQTLP